MWTGIFLVKRWRKLIFINFFVSSPTLDYGARVPWSWLTVVHDMPPPHVRPLEYLSLRWECQHIPWQKGWPGETCHFLQESCENSAESCEILIDCPCIALLHCTWFCYSSCEFSTERGCHALPTTFRGKTPKQYLPVPTSPFSSKRKTQRIIRLYHLTTVLTPNFYFAISVVYILNWQVPFVTKARKTVPARTSDSPQVCRSQILAIRIDLDGHWREN